MALPKTQARHRAFPQSDVDLDGGIVAVTLAGLRRPRTLRRIAPLGVSRLALGGPVVREHRALNARVPAALRVDELDAMLTMADLVAHIQNAELDDARLLGREIRGVDLLLAKVQIVPVGLDIFFQLPARDLIKVQG